MKRVSKQKEKGIKDFNIIKTFLKEKKNHYIVIYIAIVI